MNNFTSIIIAIMAHLGQLTEAEAKSLATELHSSTLPDNYDAAHRLIEHIFAKAGIKHDTTSKRV